MSLFMAVGSPALITYSLTLTILNRIWVRRNFQEILGYLNQVDGLSVQQETHRDRLRERLQAAQYLLQESQQVPMRASEVDGWLSSLVALDDNNPWWERVNKDLQNSRRRYTFSLVAQIGWAFVAYTFTIAISLNSSPLGNSEGGGVLLTAGGGIWIWMIPVIWGWIMCGTQARACSITDALNDTTHPVFRRDTRGELLQSTIQHGIRSRPGLIPRPGLLEFQSNLLSTSASPEATGNGTVDESETSHGAEVLAEREIRHGTSMIDETMGRSEITAVKVVALKTHRRDFGEFSILDYEMLMIPSWLGFSIQGDEGREGPIFNYARLFTFREFSSSIMNAFLARIASLKADNNEDKNTLEFAESCELDEVRLQAYTQWRETNAEVWHHMLIASGAAIFVQWGTASNHTPLTLVKLIICRLAQQL